MAEMRHREGTAHDHHWPPPMHPQLIIFDCDGVLIDSEVIACRVTADALTQAGYAISTEDLVLRFAGHSSRSMYDIVERGLGHKLPEDFEANTRLTLETAFQTELRAMRGIEATLDALRIPACVASSSSPARLSFTLGLVGLHARLAPHVFSAVSVAAGKPAPDLFLLAAETMRTAPSDCLVIEDSVPGVHAARAAGMRVLGFCGGGHCAAGHAARLLDEGAMAVFSDMPKLLDLID